MKNKTPKPTTYETTWRNKWITSDATSIDEMIEAYQSTLQELRNMKEVGLDGEFGSASDDYIFFRTTDPEKAKLFGMHKEENWDEEDEDFEDSSEEDDEFSAAELRAEINESQN